MEAASYVPMEVSVPQDAQFDFAARLLERLSSPLSSAAPALFHQRMFDHAGSASDVSPIDGEGGAASSDVDSWQLQRVVADMSVEEATVGFEALTHALDSPQPHRALEFGELVNLYELVDQHRPAEEDTWRGRMDCCSRRRPPTTESDTIRGILSAGAPVRQPSVFTPSWCARNAYQHSVKCVRSPDGAHLIASNHRRAASYACSRAPELVIRTESDGFQ
jgi:hypothetical protein